MHGRAHDRLEPRGDGQRRRRTGRSAIVPRRTRIAVWRLIDFRHLEVIELRWKARVFTNRKGEEVTIWETWYAVFDAEATDEHGWFAIVRYLPNADLARGYKRVTCYCPDRWEESGAYCTHEQAVVEHRGPEPDSRPSAPPNIAALCD